MDRDWTEDDEDTTLDDDAPGTDAQKPISDDSVELMTTPPPCQVQSGTSLGGASVIVVPDKIRCSA